MARTPAAQVGIDDALARVAHASKATYVEILRTSGMSVGIYALPAGASDPQRPHSEDEIYFVLEGRGDLWTKTEVLPATLGAVLYVAASVEHHFERIEEPLRLLVVFSPAETT